MRSLNKVIAQAGLIAGLVATGAFAEDGAELFDTYCAACHNTGGIGNPGLAPPLNRPDFWQALGENAPTYLAGVMVSGLGGKLVVGGETYAGLMMPPVVAEPEEKAALGTWLLTTLGDMDAEVTVAQVEAAMADKPTHADLRAMRPEAE